MTKLSPAAQAVIDATGVTGTSLELAARGIAAAALRAAADQVVPPAIEAEFRDRNPSLTLLKAVEIRTELLAIAAELDPL
jgi:hypothetical protein